MAQYIKKEMPDMSGTGEQKAYYKLKTWRRLDFDEFVKRCSSIHRAYGKSVIEGVVMNIIIYERETSRHLRFSEIFLEIPKLFCYLCIKY